MRAVSATAAIAAAISPLVSAAVPLSSVNRVTSAPVVPGAYIVELDSPNALRGSAGAKRAYNPHDALYSGLKKRGADFETLKEYDDPEIFVGATVKINSDEDLSKLADVDGVKALHHVYIHPRPEPVSQHILQGEHDSKLPPDTFSTHKMTGVDKLHAEGLLGKGIKIAVLDTGIDYTHPTLGGGFGKGHKIYGGYDFVGDKYNGGTGAVPDPDPLDQCAGHGTHVAGIIGADLDKKYNFTGVAPSALIGAYRVFGCQGGVGDDVLVEALIKAYQDGNDILSLSLGGAQGWTSAVTAVVASRIAAKGRVVTIAAGNDGSFGGWYASAPGVAQDAISVASVENTEVTVQTATLDNGHAPIGYGSFAPLPVNGTHPLYALTHDVTIPNDACEPLPDSTPDLSQYVVLVRRGSCTFVSKIENIKAKGAKYALIYDNVAGVSGGISVGDFPAAIITKVDGEYLVGELAAGKTINISFPQDGAVTTVPSPQGGLMSSFSTFGPVNDLFFKPSLAAPGGNILSTIPVPLGAYAIESGTSMATPFVAGSAALLLEAKGKKRSNYIRIRDILQATSSPVPSSKTDGDPSQTLAQTGSGLINVYNAVHYKTEVYPTELKLNDTAHAVLSHKISVTNHEAFDQQYTITHVPAGTANTIEGIQPIPAPVPLVTNYATMESSRNTLVVKAGHTVDFVVKFTPPKDVDAKKFPVYSGHVQIASKLETLQVSYLGVAANVKDLRVLDNTDFYFNVPLPQLLDAAGNPQTNNAVYGFQGNDFPLIVYRLAAGSPAVYIDLINAKTNKKAGEIASYFFQSRNSNGDAQNNGYNTLALDKAEFSNGKPIPDGSYKFRIRALRITGNPKNAKDFDTWDSPVVTFDHNAAAPTTTASAAPAPTESSN